ncbi:MAG: outer membrane protein transport protein [Gammaproteobacteria bacterium]
MSSKTAGRLAALLLGLPVLSVQAAGLWLYEMGTPDVGTASAGMASRAADAATAFANPAGMTRLKDSQLMVGVQPLYSRIKFDTDQATYGGTNGGNAGGWTPTGSLSYVYSHSSDIKLGVTAGSYLGLGVDFDNDWAGRYYVQKEEFLTSFLNGAFGYRVNDWLSVGGGVSLVYGSLDAQTNVNNLLDNKGDGRLKFDDTDTDTGWNAGLLIEPRPGTRVGLTYISKVDLGYKDNPSLHGAGPQLNAALKASGLKGAEGTFDFTLPNQLMLSGYHELTPDLALMVDLGWQNWSQFGDIGVSIDSATSTSTSVDAHFQDTWHTAVGARYRLNPLWSVSAGIAYDSSPVKNSDRSIVLPLDRQYRYAMGLQYAWRKDLTLGAAFEYMNAGSAPVNQTGGLLKGNLKGDLKDDDFYFLALSANWTF